MYWPSYQVPSMASRFMYIWCLTILMTGFILLADPDFPFTLNYFTSYLLCELLQPA